MHELFHQFMAQCRSREAILSYLSKFNVKSKEEVNTQDILDWCEVNFAHFNLQRKTLHDRMTIMTVTNECRNSTKKAHSEGLDDVFTRDDMGILRRL
jgi:hypothetical protein